MSINRIEDFIATNWQITGTVKDISSSGLSGSLIYKISTADANYILKGYPKKVTANNMQLLHDLLKTFAANGFDKVPQVVSTKAQQTVVLGNDRAWEILTFIDGKEQQSELNEMQIADTARSIAKFHQLSHQLGKDPRARIPSRVDKLKLLENAKFFDTLDPAKLSQLKQLSSEIYELFAEFLSRIPEQYDKYLNIDWDSLESKLPHSFVHSDLTKKNLLFAHDDTNLAGIIDFESTKYGVRVKDLARLPVEFTFGETSRISQFVAAYEQIQKLDQIEKECLPSWMCALNIGVNAWALTHFVNYHLGDTSSNSDYLVSRISRAIKFMRSS